MGIKARSRSMSAGDRDRPVRIIDFLESEMRDAWQFSGLTYEAYSSDSALRRNEGSRTRRALPSTRNILEHDYLDARLKQGAGFVQEAPVLYEAFVAAVKKLVST